MIGNSSVQINIDDVSIQGDSLIMECIEMIKMSKEVGLFRGVKFMMLIWNIEI